MAELEIIDSHLPMVAVVGRPNVGKSTFFNRVIGRRKAVVMDTPGITRDRIFERGEWNGRHFMLVDTGGYETEPRDSTFKQMREQSLIAVQEADVVIFMTEVMDSENLVDLDVVDILRRSGKPVILAVNKCDNKKRVEESYGFYSLGLHDQYPIGALSGSGVAELLDRVVKLLPPKETVEKRAGLQEGIRVAVIGRPNVGKSSIVNALLRRERVIVNPLPGTTRDAIDTSFRLKANKEGEEDRLYTLIDTAGLRRPGKQGHGVEKLSALFAGACLNRCDVALVLIDAEEGLTEQDQHIAGFAHEAYRPTVLLVNKWDLLEKNNQTAGEFVKKLRKEMGHMGYAPILMTSALSGQRVHKIMDLVDQVYAESKKEIETARLNEWLAVTTRRLSPPWHKGKQLRIKYVTQVGTHPPTFVFFVNNPKLIHFSYERYLINRLRESFGFEGTPIRIKLKRKSTKRAVDMTDFSDH